MRFGAAHITKVCLFSQKRRIFFHNFLQFLCAVLQEPIRGERKNLSWTNVSQFLIDNVQTDVME